jgi:hypothetical protein
MESTPRMEYGITHAVRTCSSEITVLNVIHSITSIKTAAVLAWLDREGVRPDNSLIIGAYLTGSGMANRLVGRSRVTVLDIYPHLRSLLHPGVSFASTLEEVTGKDWDFIFDTSGLGGISPDNIRQLSCTGAFLVEDPASDGSDRLIRNTSRCREVAGCVRAKKTGILHTGGLKAKTSGTMTLTLEVLRHAMADSLREEGVLYSIAPLEFTERILFHEKDAGRFMQSLDRPALVVSTLREVDCTAFVLDVVETIQSRVIDVTGGENHEGSGIFQKSGGKNPPGTVVGGRSGWFYRPG